MTCFSSRGRRSPLLWLALIPRALLLAATRAGKVGKLR